MKRPPRRTYPRCACSKVACQGLEQARAIHAEIWAIRGGEVLVRYYTCQFGYTHWTRQLEPQQQRNAA